MSQRSVPIQPLSANVIAATGLIAVAAYVAILLLLMETTTYDFWGAPVVIPILFAVTIPSIRRQARREADPRLFWLLTAALSLKLTGAFARYYQVFVLYEKGDARTYHEVGVQVAHRFLQGNFHPGLGSLSPEDVIGVVTGVIYTVFRPSVLIGFLVFSWLGFLGLFWFYRAFQLAVPTGRSRTYARLLFFLPSLLFWPSSIGKEAWMLCTIGLAAYGAARLLAGAGWVRGASCLAVGLLGAGAVRPHFAGILLIAVAIAFLIRRSPPAYRQLTPIVKVATAVAVVGLTVLAIGKAQDFFVEKGFTVGRGLDSVGGISDVLAQTTEQTSSGGSGFTVAGISSPAAIVVSVGTVLFRPFPNEAGNVQSLLTAVESSALLLITLVRFRWLVAAVGRMRTDPYIACLAAYVFGSVLALSSIANFGILARERVLLLPAYVALLSIPPVPPPRDDVTMDAVASSVR